MSTSNVNEYKDKLTENKVVNQSERLTFKSNCKICKLSIHCFNHFTASLVIKSTTTQTVTVCERI